MSSSTKNQLLSNLPTYSKTFNDSSPKVNLKSLSCQKDEIILNNNKGIGILIPHFKNYDKDNKDNNKKRKIKIDNNHIIDTTNNINQNNLYKIKKTR